MKLHLLTWLIIPFFGIFIVTNYLINSTKSSSQPTNKLSGQLKLDVLGEARDQILKDFSWKRQSLVSIWFDDAWATQYEIAFPILETKKIKAALAVPTNFVGFEAYMNWNQIKRLQFKGWEITSHTRSHSCKEEAYRESKVVSELVGAKEDLETQGLLADNYVAPCGITTERILEYATTNYVSLRTSEAGVNLLPITNPYSLKAVVINQTFSEEDVKRWLRQAENQRSWLIFVFHQIDNSKRPYSLESEKFRKIIDIIENSNLEIVLPSQALSI